MFIFLHHLNYNFKLGGGGKSGGMAMRLAVPNSSRPVPIPPYLPGQQPAQSGGAPLLPGQQPAQSCKINNDCI